MRATTKFERVKFGLILINVQVGLFVLFARYVQYGEHAQAGFARNSVHPARGGLSFEKNNLRAVYPSKSLVIFQPQAKIFVSIHRFESYFFSSF